MCAAMEPAELVESVNEWFFEMNCMHDSVLDFARSYRGHFSGEGEHSHDAHSVYAQFKQQFEGCVNEMLAARGATLETYGAAVEVVEADGDLGRKCTTEVVT